MGAPYSHTCPMPLPSAHTRRPTGLDEGHPTVGGNFPRGLKLASRWRELCPFRFQPPSRPPPGEEEQVPDWCIQEEARGLPASALPPASPGPFLPIGSVCFALLPATWMKVPSLLWKPTCSKSKSLLWTRKLVGYLSISLFFSQMFYNLGWKEGVWGLGDLLKL